MVNELTEVIRVLSKIRVSEDNCSLFLTGYMSALYPHKNESDELFIKGDLISVRTINTDDTDLE